VKDDNDGCGNDWLMLGLALIIVAVVVVACVAPAHADTQVVGDSLTAQTYDASSDGWQVDGLNGRALHGNLPLVASHAGDRLVVALGSNDVAQRQPVTTLGQVAALPGCVVVTTVKVGGVSGFYNPQWALYARRWNRAVWQSGVVVANWNGAARGHAGWFLADGLHLTATGEDAYDQLLRSAAEQCPVVEP
jgi:hypothetical protein